MSLIQIATMAGFSYIFDVLKCPELFDAGLKDLLENPEVVKVKLN